MYVRLCVCVGGGGGGGGVLYTFLANFNNSMPFQSPALVVIGFADPIVIHFSLQI